MVRLDCQVTGVEETRNLLGQIPAAMRVRLLAAMAQVVQEVGSTTQALAPERSGALARSIKGRVQTRADAVTGTVSVGKWYGRMVEAGVDASVQVRPFARMSHRGTVYAVGGYTREIHLPARPFLRPAYQQLQDRIEATLAQAIQGAVNG